MSTHPPNRVQTLLQTYEWHTSSTAEHPHYLRLKHLLPQFASIGITAIWLPPGCKANDPHSNGYDAYDLWDLGEFEQKGARSTKWGSREQLDDLICRAQERQIDVVWDAVLNHKQAGDRPEADIWAVEVDPKDRRYEICPPKKIEAWLQYDFPGREAEGMKYSKMKWRAEHFNGTDWDQSRGRHAIYKLIDDPSIHPPFRQPPVPDSFDATSPRSRLSRLHRRFISQSGRLHSSTTAPQQRPGKGWADDVDKENGNNDYLMFANIDFTHPEVRQDVLRWGPWMVQEVGLKGFRLDAVQHFSFRFSKEWIEHVRRFGEKRNGAAPFVVAEIWTRDVRRITKWLDNVQGSQVYAFDSPLLYNFSRISEDIRNGSKNTDLRTILRDSLLQQRPSSAVTQVTNHDTQPGQASYTPLMAALKPLFYAFILLRREGYPCVFWGDIFGTGGPHAEGPTCIFRDPNAPGRQRSLLIDLILCRKLFAYGEQRDYWFSQGCIGWTRAGVDGDNGCVVLLNSASEPVVQTMSAGRPGQTWSDVLGQMKGGVQIDAKGTASFVCSPCSVSVFVRDDHPERNEFPVHFDLRLDQYLD